MRAEGWLALFVAGLLSVSALGQITPRALPNKKGSDSLTPSEHRPGPHALEGWTLAGPLPDGPEDKYPFVLVIARNGREIRRFSGGAFVWKWMFVADGRQVAYESGPLHFSMACVLADIETGRELETYDCWGELPDSAPEWVQALEGPEVSPSQA